ncbi:MAG: peptidase S55 SpoIVB, partial [Firmicutes bacterium]|nr:peptidase S55 SpoIVB [Bacillota bacterium]
MRKFQSLILILSLFLICFNSSSALEIFPLEDVRSGLQGVGRTVIAGTEIEDFEVEVLGLVPQGPPLGNLIMVKVGGEVMDKTGGIALGMSGTPVYIGNQLLGAIGYTYSLTDHRIGLVTPAEAMFKIYDQIPGQILDLPFGAAPVRSPLMVGGMNQRVRDFLERALASYQIQVMNGPALKKDMQSLPLEAGSMLGVQLLRGDFQVATFGTVTHVEEDGRFLAFGHPFTHRGSVDFFATGAYVHYTLPSLDVPYKIVSLGSEIGGVFQDRAAGLGGNLGIEPPSLPVRIVVE